MMDDEIAEIDALQERGEKELRAVYEAALQTWRATTERAREKARERAALRDAGFAPLPHETVH
jgi:hypothetical protein